MAENAGKMRSSGAGWMSGFEAVETAGNYQRSARFEAAERSPA